MFEDNPENEHPSGTVILTRYKPAYKSGPGELWNSYKKMLCGVIDCTSCTYSSPELWFYRLPLHVKEKQRRQTWLTQIGRPDLPTYDSLLVCEKHFKPSDFMASTYKAKKPLKPQAIPTLLLPSYKPMPCRAAKPKRVYRRINNTESNSNREEENACIEESGSTNLQANIENNSNCDSSLVQLSNTLKLKKTKDKTNTKKYSDESKLKIFNLYYKNAVVYEVLQSTLGLPSISILPSFIPSTPAAVNEIFLADLKAQVTLLSPMQKYCMLCLSFTRVKPHVDYNVRSDTVSGVSGRSSVDPVQYAVIAMVRGITSDWHRIASIIPLASLDMLMEYNTCLDKLILTMTELGIYIKAIMTSTDDFFINAFALRDVCMTRPFFIINKRKVYHLFDPQHLMLLLYNTIHSKTVTFTEELKGERIAKWDHISQFYDIDSERTFRLTNKSSEIDPNDLQQNKFKSAVQILSMNTATGISIFIDLKILEKEAKDTLDFIVRINEMFTALYPKGVQPGYEHNQKLNNQEFWRNNIQFLQCIKICQANPEDRDKLVNCFSTNMKSILLLKEEYFVTNVASLNRYLHQDPLVEFIHTINIKKFTYKYPSLNELIDVIKDYIIENNLHDKTRDRDNCRSDKFMEDVKIIIEQNEIEKTTLNKSLDTEYIKMDNCYDTNSLVSVATYLLDKMYEKYKNSVSSRMKMMTSSVYYERKQGELSGSLIAPDNTFLQCIYDMDAVFANSCQKAMATGNLYEEVMKEMNKYICSSFIDIKPLKYVLGLFVRLRIDYTIKYNNNIYDTADDEEILQFVAPRLSSQGLNLDDPKCAKPKFKI